MLAFAVETALALLAASMMEPNKLWDPDAELALESVLDVLVVEVPVLEMLPRAELSPPWPPFLWACDDNPEMTALMAPGMASSDIVLSCCDFGCVAGKQAARSCRLRLESGEPLPR